MTRGASPPRSAASRRASSSSESGLRRLLLPGAVTASAIALAAVAMMAPGLQLDPATDCPLDGRPSKVRVLALDSSDPLLAAQPGAVDGDVDAAIAGLPGGARLVVVEVRDPNPVEPKVLFTRCIPGTASNAERNRFRDAVIQPIKTRVQALVSKPAANTSPIIETVLAIADSRKLHIAGVPLEILLASDGIENGVTSVYHGGALPKPPAHLLAGVRITIMPLRNDRDLPLQVSALPQLAAWFKSTDADVTYTPPAWLAFAGETRRDRP